MSLRVTVKNATDLPNFESIGKIDPLVVLKFRGNLYSLKCLWYMIYYLNDGFVRISKEKMHVHYYNLIIILLS